MDERVLSNWWEEHFVDQHKIIWGRIAQGVVHDSPNAVLLPVLLKETATESVVSMNILILVTDLHEFGCFSHSVHIITNCTDPIPVKLVDVGIRLLLPENVHLQGLSPECW